MEENQKIRKTRPDDFKSLELLYISAFPDEELVPLLTELHNDRVNVLSLVFEDAGCVIGHIAFTNCKIGGQLQKVSLLGPLVVAPDMQQQGVGSSLIKDGLRLLSRDDFVKIFVLGDPGFYSHFGFLTEQHISPPYPIPEKWKTAWQSLSLTDKQVSMGSRLSVPKPWQKPSLWAA